MNEKLKAIYKTDEIKGGKRIILSGDLAQLRYEIQNVKVGVCGIKMTFSFRPVADKPIYLTGDTLSELERRGSIAYRSFNQVLEKPLAKSNHLPSLSF